MTKDQINKDVSVIGLGKLGAPIAATFASKGHRVIGVDTNADQYEVTLQLMVQLMDAPGGGTTVRTMMDANITLFHAIILSDSTIIFNGEQHHHTPPDPDSSIFSLSLQSSHVENTKP